jgi:hypothetical protein
LGGACLVPDVLGYGPGWRVRAAFLKGWGRLRSARREDGGAKTAHRRITNPRYYRLPACATFASFACKKARKTA